MALSDSDSSIRVYMREIVKTDLISPEKEIELADRIRDGDESAREHMIKANLRLVVKIARDYSNYGVPMADLISEGNIGLMKAVEKFDPAKGGKLSTYASWWIKQSIKRALANQSKTIRLPVHLVDKLAKVRRITALLTEELGREPTDDELVEASLDAPLGEEESSSYAEIIGDENAVSPLDALESKNDHGELETLLKLLDERETEIIDSRFGLNGKKPMTLEEISRNFGVSRERIRQLQNIALGKMKRALNRKEAAPKGKEALG